MRQLWISPSSYKMGDNYYSGACRLGCNRVLKCLNEKNCRRGRQTQGGCGRSCVSYSHHTEHTARSYYQAAISCTMLQDDFKLPQLSLTHVIFIIFQCSSINLICGGLKHFHWHTRGFLRNRTSPISHQSISRFLGCFLHHFLPLVENVFDFLFHVSFDDLAYHCICYMRLGYAFSLFIILDQHILWPLRSYL